MRQIRVKWIRKLFIVADPGLVLSLEEFYSKDDVKRNSPRTLFRKAKQMWNENHPATKTWGKYSKDNMNKSIKEIMIENLKKKELMKGVNNG